MSSRKNGTAGAFQNLTGCMEFFVLYAKSPYSFTSPNPNPSDDLQASRLINIFVTGNLADNSQKNFEILFQAISLRATPTLMLDPVVVADLAAEGAPTLSGQGFVYKFTVERESVFHNFGPSGTIGVTGLLVDELDGVILDNGVRVTTVDSSPSGVAKNMEFAMVSLLR